MKAGFTAKEIRGVVILLLLILFVLSFNYLLRYINGTKYQDLALDNVEAVEVQKDSVELFDFDPNTVELSTLMRLGLEKREAVSIIRYREYGKVFRIKEDLFACYGISDSLYYLLEPYIVIGDEFRLSRKEEYNSWDSSSAATESKRTLLPLTKFLVDTVGANYFVAVGVLSRRQADVFVKWRDMSGIYNMDELRECYVVSDSVADLLEPYAIFTPPVESKESELIDINSADSVTLCGIYGVGAKSAEAIINYREALGGFYSLEQLSELKVISESNFEKIIQQISCDSCDISKIDVNFASAKTMKGHPYITDRVLRRLLKIRELKGGWSTTREMIEDDIFTEVQEAKVRPYIIFGDFEPR